MRLLRRSAAPPVHANPNADEARWALAETVRDGRPILARRNLALEPLLAAPSHPLLLCVTVDGDTSDPEQLAKLAGFETALFGILGQDELCWAAAVVTTDDARQFLLYAREREPLLPRLAFIRQEFPLEFDLSLQEDADRAVFRRLPGRS
jgi:hypothetical protein